MNRVMLRTLVIANKWLDRCWNSEQHDRIYEMADGGFVRLVAWEEGSF